MHELRHRNLQLSELLFENFLNVYYNVFCTKEILDHDIISSILKVNERLSDPEVNKITPRLALKQPAE